MGSQRHRQALAVACLAVALILTACSRSDTLVEYTPTPPSDPQIERAIADAEQAYLIEVDSRLAELETLTVQFGDAFATGDERAARGLYLRARALWESVRPVVREFPDLLAAINARQSDLGPMELWTGWHQAEKSLWPESADDRLGREQRTAVADALMADTRALVERVAAPDFAFAAANMAEGATEAIGHLSVNHALGHSEVYSDADLWGIQGGLDGAYAAYLPLRDVIVESNPRLVETLDERFAAAQTQLDRHGSSNAGFALHGELTTAEVRDLVRALDALAEPLARLAPALAPQPMAPETMAP